ncbi:MAG TPA: two-component regulator propeller domain-containing protein, partial [Thermoanaerobaculia bacterium]|nr:two-component regulator propeller domain-containing protein [Thermoanaerobaculia bacterium]
MLSRRIFLLALLLASVAGAFDLPPGTYPFRTYGRDAGLGNLSVTRIAQDSVGFIWVATQEGIYRYDGSRFTRFGLENGLPSTYVTHLVAGPRGELWAATNSGVVRWNGARFEAEPLLPRVAANSIALDANGRLWAALPQGLFVAGNRVAGFDGEATAVWCDGADTWAASLGKIGRLSRGAWTWWTVPRERIDAIVVDNERHVWARSGNHLFASDGAGAFRDEQSSLPATSTNGYLCLDARGNLWVPTDRGVAVHERGAWRVIGSDDGLPTEWARHVMEDREGSIWVASLGIHRLLGRGELVSYKRADGLPNEVIWCFLRDRDGRLLVGTDLGLARSLRTQWDVVRGTEGLQVRSVADDDGVLWTGGTPAEILRIDGANVRRYGEADGVVARTILHIARDRNGTIWAGTRAGGLLRKAANEERFTRVDVPLGDAAEDFRYVIEDSRGRIWAAGNHGLAMFANGRWRRYTTKDGLADAHLSYLMETAAGDLWIAYFEPHGI